MNSCQWLSVIDSPGYAPCMDVTNRAWEPLAGTVAAGGPGGLAEKVFRTLPLDPEATAANTLAPAVADIIGTERPTP